MSGPVNRFLPFLIGSKEFINKAKRLLGKHGFRAIIPDRPEKMGIGDATLLAFCTVVKMEIEKEFQNQFFVEWDVAQNSQFFAGSGWCQV